MSFTLPATCAKTSTAVRGQVEITNFSLKEKNLPSKTKFDVGQMHSFRVHVPYLNPGMKWVSEDRQACGHPQGRPGRMSVSQMTPGPEEI